MKTIFIIALIIFAIWYLAPGTFDNLKDKAKDAVSVDNENSQKVKDLVGDFIEDNESTTDLTNSSENEEVDPEPEPEVFPCDLPNYGLPDYEGTTKEGDDCMDVPLNQDYECLANPPTNYDGYINLIGKISDPQIICCETDGYCRWGDE